MGNKKKICALAATAVITVPLALPVATYATGKYESILTKLERQLSVDKIMKDIEKLSMENGQNKDNARVTGFAGEHEAAYYIQKQFDKLGMDTKLEKIDNIDGYIAEGQSLTIDEKEYEVKAMTFSLAGNVEANIVNAGLGSVEECEKANLEGKIALIQRGEFSFTDKAKNAYESGAKGVIIYNNQPGVLSGTLGDLESSKVQTVGMSQEDGQKLVARLNSGEALKAKLSVDAKIQKDSHSYNVVGKINAPKKVKNPKTIIIGAHFDSVNCPGANDNASGTATIIEVARLLSKPEVKNKLLYNIEFVGFGAEEIGLIGSDKYASELVASGKAKDVFGMINLDMVGTGDKVVTYNYVAEEDEVAHRMTNIAHENIEELGYDFGGHYRSGSSDHAPFEAVGIPSVFLQVDKDPYYHTDEDTVDKIDPDNIKDIATLVLNMVMDIQEKEYTNAKPKNVDEKIEVVNEKMLLK